MFPTFAHSTVTERYEYTHCQHQRIPFRFGIGLIYESAYSRVLLVNKITEKYQR